MKIKYVIFSLLTSFCLITANASPARKGIFTLSQPDGSRFTAVQTGDEFGHIKKTTDGCAIIQDEDGWYSYALFDEQGHRYSSGVHVGSNAPADILAGSRNIPWNIIRQNALEKRRQLADIRSTEEEPLLRRVMKAQGVTPGTKASTPAKKHGIVLLVEFSDVYFQSANNLQAFQNLLTQNGYSRNGATGSALDYFNDQFRGSVEFDFDVAGPLRLSRKRNYYGGNDSEGYDKHPEEMISDACKLAYNNGVDFSLYDNDNDGWVDNVFVFFAGEDEAEYYSDEECIWSHAYYLYQGAGITAKYNGKQIDSYACTSELTWISERQKKMAGIGTFCHEYSHTFGLPDFYDTDYGGQSATDDDPYISMAAGLWTYTALMDGGNQNNDSNTPPYYNCIEREYLGMAETEELQEGNYVLEPVNKSGKCYRISTEDPDEYFLIECRSNSGWDKYINWDTSINKDKVKGLLLYHIDKSKNRKIYSEEFGKSISPYQRWEEYNEVNANPDHQCADLVEADGRADKFKNFTHHNLLMNDLSGLFYPNGSTTIKTSVLTSWNGTPTGFAISGIAFDGENVKFTATKRPMATGIMADPFQTEARINWETSHPGLNYKTIAVLKDSRNEEKIFEITPYSGEKFTLELTDLTPATAYTLTLKMDCEDSIEQEISFTTSKVRDYPYIYLTSSLLDKNSDGSFPKGSKIPLKVFNVQGCTSISWQFNGKDISTGANGYYTLTSGGTLKAIVNYAGGAREIIEREIITK